MPYYELSLREKLEKLAIDGSTVTSILDATTVMRACYIAANDIVSKALFADAEAAARLAVALFSQCVWKMPGSGGS